MRDEFDRILDDEHDGIMERLNEVIHHFTHPLSAFLGLWKNKI
jgi:hypothetical protein